MGGQEETKETGSKKGQNQPLHEMKTEDPWVVPGKKKPEKRYSRFALSKHRARESSFTNAMAGAPTGYDSVGNGDSELLQDY